MESLKLLSGLKSIYGSDSPQVELCRKIILIEKSGLTYGLVDSLLSVIQCMIEVSSANEKSCGDSGFEAGYKAAAEFLYSRLNEYIDNLSSK